MIYLFMAKVVNGLYVYEPDGYFNWDQLMPLLKILGPFLMVVCVPLIVVGIIYAAIEGGKQTSKTVGNVVKAFTEDDEEEEDG